MGRKRITLPDVEEASIARSGLHQAAVTRLRQMIVAGDLLPGARLGEKALSEALGISRTPLRESLKLLASEGLVEIVPNKGAWVAALDAEEIRDLFEAAAGMERAGAELAAGRLTPADLERLKSLQAEIEDEFGRGERERYFVLNQEIHRSILAGSKNEVLIAAHGWLFPRLERARYHALRSDERWRHSVAEHRDILKALEARDGDAAGRLIADHVMETGRSITRGLTDRAAA